MRGSAGGTGPFPSAFGFRVDSRERLLFARSGGGVEPLEVVRSPDTDGSREEPSVPPIVDRTLSGTAGDVRMTLYKVGTTFEYWISDTGVYRIDPEHGRIEIPGGGQEIVREQRLWALPSTLCYMHRGDFSLHSAAVEVDGGAVLLAAPGGFGKTTLALGFHLQGHRMLTEDLACCRVGPTLQVLPGPALLRARPDIYAGEPPPGTHVVLEQPDRIFLSIDRDRRGSGAPVPLRAIVFLRESADGPRLEPAEPSVALVDLWALNFRLPTDEGRAYSFQQLSRLAGDVPVWNVYRPLRRDRLDETVARIVERVVRG